MESKDFPKEPFLLSEAEAIALWKFLLECGYISYEFHEDVHKIWAKLEKFVSKRVS
jgi:hypothetical protein